ncbi:hypothetical protein MVQ23_09835 [Fusobacterium necrophorum]|uniref:hypothetical protein n=1 Tax=Fusobacterium necrophorum TaxID=859 RepID=UPI002549DE5F|nr:hypothetical protein [Fusobacterium necrophorum]MDK4486142.1 hypothetical protein [Fusobacterium necrophorum]
MSKIVDTYLETQDFHETVRRCKISPLIAHLTLAKAGVLKIHDKINYGTKAQALGGRAEEYFQKLVPEAIDANRFWKTNNPVYDFMFKGLKIDVKYSSLRPHTNTPCWCARVSGEQDITVIFLEKERGTELKDPYILLIPSGFVSVKNTMHISKSGRWLSEFQVEADELNSILNDYAGVLEM